MADLWCGGATEVLASRDLGGERIRPWTAVLRGRYYEQSWRWDSFGSPAQGSVIGNSEGCIDWGDPTTSTCPSTAAESCVGCADAHPPDLSINSSTGIVTFDTTNKSGLYWTGVVSESRSAMGAVVATSHIQYIINVGASGSLNQAPVCDSPPTPADGTVFTINPGETVSFTMQASDPDRANTSRS